ncbi:DEAD-domain-containing protein [Rhizoclosmatium globosum]|uniref:ATP-dependent RNA helicase n=1 Tax=Rhizoclosmatium globosum TaxID=329046 RepID=A0A1Y2CJ30_9FUNG|nr:DEAD-domain-containing protein [Rhizoclosmatium globosum]|eukprot:ORY47060.1 DEAD-domain-containing protein [Rhizoclosmatium globosum]
MADDGLQLNFAAPTGDSSSSFSGPNVKGSWKKKRIVTKIAKHKALKFGSSSSDRQSSGASAAKPTAYGDIKRDNRKIDVLSASSTATATASANSSTASDHVKVTNPANKLQKSPFNKQPSSLQRDPSAPRAGPPPKPKTFVTSLFSGNDSTATPTTPVHVADVKQSSNAVPTSTSDTTTFAGLGLNPLLISHLTLKMGVSVPTRIQQATLAALVSESAGRVWWWWWGHREWNGRHTDCMVQAQTGSGKTLAYLLPIVHRLIQAERELAVDDRPLLNRTLGTLAIVLAPTRELAKQINTVLEQLLMYSRGTGPRAASESKKDEDEDDNDDDEEEEKPAATTSSTPKISKHWIVPGLVVGGDKKKSEKARLRKGCTILVSTPGRLIDHLKTTQSFELGNLRWLVLDEADRFLELGFEETLRELLSIIDAKRKRILLTSATIKGNVQRLAETSLKNPLFIKAADDEEEAEKKADGFDLAKKASKGKDFILKKDAKEGKDEEDEGDDFWEEQQKRIAERGDEVVDDYDEPDEDDEDAMDVSKPSNDDDAEEMFTVPEQLKQTYVLAPAKLRLVSLVAVLRKIALKEKPFKAILFTDTCDSKPDEPAKPSLAPTPADTLPPEGLESPLFPHTRIYKLHGNLSQKSRDVAYKGFKTSPSSVLICTDVAARGLDLPDIGHVVQYDMPSDVKDYVHRVGRTARVGREGEAVSLLLPSEAGYIELLGRRGVKVGVQDGMELLKSLVGAEWKKGKGKKKGVEDWATDVQMMFERFVLADEKNLELARNAFRSHVRAYTTHTAAEKRIFNIKNLHLGHVAKSFALRDAPGLSMGAASSTNTKKGQQHGEKKKAVPNLKKRAYQLQSTSASASEFGDGGVQKLVGGTRKKVRVLY